ncbi:hypothetical protein JCM10207_005968 [Rhodosporidiobolus poonsookiae]
MSSLDPNYGDSQSPEVAPTSLASSPRPAPPTAADSATAKPAARAPARVTYGRKVVLDAPPTAEPKEGRAVERNSTMVVLETEFDLPDGESSSEEGAALKRRNATTSSSSPTKRNVHSTDPTSEDEDEAPKKADPFGGLSSGSDSEADAEDDDKFARFKLGGVKNLLDEVDRDFDARADLPTPAVARVKSSSTLPTITASSSDLPPLTESEETSSRLNTSSQATPIATHSRPSYRAKSPSSALRLPDSAPRDGDEPITTARQRARIADSEDDEDVAPQPSRKSTLRAAVPDSSDREEDEELEDRSAAPPKSSAPAPTLSKNERLALLVAKKQKAMPPVEEKRKPVYEDADDMIEGDDEDEEGGSTKRKGKKPATKKTKTRPLSKKVEEEMNRQTAAFARTSEAPYPTPISNPSAAVVTIETSSDAIETSSSPGPSRTPADRKLFSLRNITQQPDSSPIVQATPVPNRVRVPAPPLGAGWQLKKRETPAPEAAPADDDDSDDELPTLGQNQAQQTALKQAKEAKEKEAREKEARKKRLAEMKSAAVSAARKGKQAAADDSDSDIEIEGAPGAAKKALSRQASGSKDVFKAVLAEPRTASVALKNMFRTIAGVDTAHPPAEEDEPTESQMEAAGREFGRNLGPDVHYDATPAKKASRKGSSSAKKRSQARPNAISLDTLNQSLFNNIHLKNHEQRTKKARDYRRKQDEGASAPREVESVDVKAMLERKKQQNEEDAEMEDAEDGDYQDDEDEGIGSGEGGEHSDDLEGGSGSDVPAGEHGVEEEEEEGELNSDGELAMPPSSQNSDRLAHVKASQQEHEQDEDADEAQMLPPALPRKAKARIVLSDEEGDDAPAVASNSTDAPAPTEVVSSGPAPPAPAKVAFGDLFGGGDDAGGGFSQFFNSQFSQNGGDDAQVEGFLRPADNFEAPAPTMFAGQDLISTAERAADAARLEARGGFNDFEPGTPREAPAARQYINQQGFLTQTRPANAFLDSPSDSPAFSFRNSLSTRDSESQLGAETQLQTPTQTSKDPTKLRRLNAMITYGSLPATEVQPDPTEVARSASNGEEVEETQEETQQEETQQEETQREETQEETQDAMPSAAQPPTAAPKTAFDVLRAGAAQLNAPPPVPQPKRRERNAFVDTEANLSDEEEGLGLGGLSGDEDEEGHDAELEELVDNEEIAHDLREEQDERAGEHHAEYEDEQEAVALKRAQDLAAGKLRNKRKGHELSDDDFDDEYVGIKGRREKRVRADDLTVEQLKNNEETQAFASNLVAACVPTAKEGAYSFLESQEKSDAEDDEDDGRFEPGEADDVFGAVAPVPQLKLSRREALMAAVQQTRERWAPVDEDVEVGEEGEDGYLSDGAFSIHLGGSSSPVAPLKTNNRILAAATVKTTSLMARAEEEFDTLDSQYGYLHAESVQSKVQYRAGDGREESQSAAVTGSRSAVTSFKRSAPGKNASTSAGNSKGAKNGGAALGPKPSKLGGLRKGGFA